MYSVIDWSKPGVAVGFVLLSAVVTLVLWVAVCILNKYVKKWALKCFESKIVKRRSN